LVKYTQRKHFISRGKKNTYLNIQPNKSLTNPKANSQNHPLPNPHPLKLFTQKSAQIPNLGKVMTRGKQILHIGKEGYVTRHAEEETGCAEFTSAADYFKDFGFDFSFEGGVEFVSDFRKNERGCMIRW
jgi:hypothetical protein